MSNSKIKVLNANNEAKEVEVIRYFELNGESYLLYSLNETDEQDYIKLYGTKVNQMQSEEIPDDEWQQVKDKIKEIIKGNIKGNLEVNDLNFYEINGLVVNFTPIFKLSKNLVNLLKANQKEFDVFDVDDKDEPIDKQSIDFTIEDNQDAVTDEPELNTEESQEEISDEPELNTEESQEEISDEPELNTEESQDEISDEPELNTEESQEEISDEPELNTEEKNNAYSEPTVEEILKTAKPSFHEIPDPATNENEETTEDETPLSNQNEFDLGLDDSTEEEVEEKNEEETQINQPDFEKLYQEALEKQEELKQENENLQKKITDILNILN